MDHPQKAGSVPQADIVASFQDALVAAGDITDPHIWYMSRQGVPYDWDYGAIDEGRAIASTSLPGGRIPQPITALANLVDDYLILGCTSSMYIMRGDPRVGGRIDLLSDRAGIFDSQAWCHLPDGTILALSHFAIHHIVPGSGAEVSVRDLSEGALPDEFLHFSRSQHYVNMVYDLAHRGAYIFFTPRDARAGGKKKGVAGDQPEFTNSGGGNGGGGGNEPPPTIGGRGQHWFWSWDTKGFFPVILANGQDPMAALYYDSDIPSDRGVLLGCLDGQMRKIDRSSSTDDEVPIDNFAVLGPFKLTSSEHVSAVLLEAIPVFSHATGEVNWGVVGDDYPERVIERAIDDDFDAEGVWESGLGFHEKPAVRGTYFAIKISGNGRTHWSLEAVSITAREAGRTLRA